MNKEVSVIIPVMNETFSLQKTVDIVMQENADHVKELLIIVHPERTTQESFSVIENLKKQHPETVCVIEQKKSFLGGAMQDAFDAVEGRYALLMSSDLETDPHTVKDMIIRMDKGDTDIVATSRWIGGGGFKGYNKLKLVSNWVFQKMFSVLFRTRLTDLTFGFRLYKTEVLKGIKWDDLKHPFLLECLLKPLKLGARAVEVASPWKAREEGESSNTVGATFAYVKTGFKILFLSKKSFTINK